MDSFQFLLLAERLLKSDSHPAGNRSAVSRAYYAAYHCARDFVEGAGVHLKRGHDSHGDVTSHLTSNPDVGIERIGSELSDLRTARIVADYELANRRPESSDTAAAQVVLARELIEAVRECQRDAARYELVKQAIRQRHQVLRGLGGA